MDSKVQMFYVMACVTVLMLIVNFFAARFVVSRNLQFIRLKDGNTTTTGKITKIMKSRGGPIACYEFNSMYGEIKTGSQFIPKGSKVYSKGDEIEIVYLPDNSSMCSIKELLDGAITRAQGVIKIFPYLPLQGIVVFGVLWAILVTQHIVSLPF